MTGGAPSPLPLTVTEVGPGAGMGAFTAGKEGEGRGTVGGRVSDTHVSPCLSRDTSRLSGATVGASL